MASKLDEALRQFEAVEANVKKLERLWDKIEAMLPNSTSIASIQMGAEEPFLEATRSFGHILKSLPAIDGFQLEYCIEDYDSMQRSVIDTVMYLSDEPTAIISEQRFFRKQGESLGEYRFRLDVKRRELARMNYSRYAEEIDSILAGLKPISETLGVNEAMPVDNWEKLTHAARAIDVLLGSSVSRPKQWPNLLRHIHFGLNCDYKDIVATDWPDAKSHLETEIYTDNDPIPVAVKDLGELVASNPKGEVVTELKWANLTAADFERLVFNLISAADGYHNPMWPTHTNASDDGRDLSVNRIYEDKLSGAKNERCIIACKHYTSRSVSPTEVGLLRDQMRFWEPPRVDCLIIATSGNFTSPAIRMIDLHNQDDNALTIEYWSGTTFERLLAQRPELIAEFNLR